MEIMTVETYQELANVVTPNDKIQKRLEKGKPLSDEDKAELTKRHKRAVACAIKCAVLSGANDLLVSIAEDWHAATTKKAAEDALSCFAEYLDDVDDEDRGPLSSEGNKIEWYLVKAAKAAHPRAAGAYVRECANALGRLLEVGKISGSARQKVLGALQGVAIGG